MSAKVFSGDGWIDWYRQETVACSRLVAQHRLSDWSRQSDSITSPARRPAPAGRVAITVPDPLTV